MRRAETAAKDFAAQWQTTFDAISDAVLLVSPDGIIERCNTAFCSLMHKSAEEVVGRNVSDVVGPAALDQSVYFRMLGSRHRESTERCVNETWYNISADPVIDSEGVFKGGVLIISNITDRKRAEEARMREKALLQQTASELEAKVHERTRQLEESVNSMEGFCYTIAHDLRAPLRAVNGFTSALLEHYSPNFDAEGKVLAGRITAAAKRMDRLIEELLAFGRLSNQDLPRRGVDLEGIVQNTVTQFAAEIREKNAEVTVLPPLPNVWANPTIVEQIVSNLLANALKFIGPGMTPKVTVRAEQSGDMVRLWVEDNGIGIEPAYHEKIFGVFQRLHTDKQYRGTGIGLAIVRKGVERMGGRTGLESQPGKGSRFWVELPARGIDERNTTSHSARRG
jgi:PAS domain S-box-containing protein